MKTHPVSLKKTDGIRNLLLAVGIISLLSFTFISVGLYQVKGLSIERKIEYGTRAISAVSTIFVGCVVSINVYYIARLVLNIEQGGLTRLVLEELARNQSLEKTSSKTEATQERLISGSFFSAIDQLGSEHIETRLGAIYTLGKIAKDSPSQYWTVMEILAAFIRENAAIKDEEEYIHEESLKPATDIQAALTIIGRRDAPKDPENLILDLSHTDIKGADLTKADLGSVDFSGANLQGVMFYEAYLAEADFSGANLEEAVFYEAELQGAMFFQANLRSCILTKANLTGAMLYEANLQGVTSYDANLTEAIVYKADLQGAMFYEANLTEIILEASNLKGANLIGANLQGANLIGANLQGVLLSVANIQKAVVYEANLEKANLTRANLEGSNLIGSDFKGAILEETNLCGAYLTRAKNLQLEQIQSAVGDRLTRLPDNMERPAQWTEQGNSSEVSNPESQAEPREGEA